MAMSCYHPLIAQNTGIKKNGKKSIRIIGAADNYTPDDIKNKNNCLFLIPCGKCIGCRLDYSRKWADRMMLELATAKKAVFLTLTYSDEALNGNRNGHILGDERFTTYPLWSYYNELGIPIYATVDKRDCQLFLKRLRKEFKDVELRFYLSSEYGPKTLRPHYHCIIFGIDISDIGDCVVHGRNELNQNYYISDRMNDVWKNGHVIIAEVSWNTCAYVARYVNKKWKGKFAEDFYAFRNQLPEFSLMSRNPGLGSKYLELHPECLDYSNINLSTPQGGKQISIPEYYLRKIQFTDPEKYANIKAQRSLYQNDKELLKLQKTDLGFIEQLEVEEHTKLDSISILKRNDV